MPITALPSLDRTSATFKADLDAYFLTSLPAFGTDVEAARLEIVANEASAAASASTATTQAGIATTQAGLATTNGETQVALATAQADIATNVTNYKGLWTSLTGALNMPATVYHNGNYWTLNENLANVTLATPGADTKWTPVLNGAVPQVASSSAYTLVLSDAGKHILHPSADTTARIFTIPANSSVAFPIGTAVTFVNQNSAGSLSIAITTNTMRLAGLGTTGTRTLAANGIATALKVTATEWIISGSNLS